MELSRRRKVFRRGFQRSYSLSKNIISLLATNRVTQRSFLSNVALDFHRESLDEEIPTRERRKTLQHLSNILNCLKRKNLIYIIPRKYVINVPRILYLYHVNLPANIKRGVHEIRKPDRYKNAMYITATAIRTRLGVNYPLQDAYNIVRYIVTRHYSKFHGYLVNLDELTSKISRLTTKIIESDTNEYLTNQIVEIIMHHLLDLVARTRYEDLINKLLRLLSELAGYKNLEEIGEIWRYLSSKINSLSSDQDFRTASYARQFLEESVNADIATSVPLI